MNAQSHSRQAVSVTVVFDVCANPVYLRLQRSRVCVEGRWGGRHTMSVDVMMAGNTLWTFLLSFDFLLHCCALTLFSSLFSLSLHSDLTVVSCKKLPGHGEQLCLLRSVCWLMQRLFYISGLQVKLQLAASQHGEEPWGECVFVCVCVCVCVCEPTRPYGCSLS